MSVTIRSTREIDLTREVGKALAVTHEKLTKAMRPGISTMDIDRLGEEIIRSYERIPSFRNYNGYPASICVSVNDEVVYGIPSKKRILQEDDTVSLDIGVIYKGFHSDAARTHAVEKISREAKRLIEVTKQSSFEKIRCAEPGNHLNDISSAIAAYAEKFGYGVVWDLVGHGVGSHLHEDPEIPSFPQRRRGVKLQADMTLTIEPMINAGRLNAEWLGDNWTIVTEGGSLSAHYENTILMCNGSLEILSMFSLDGKSPPPVFGKKG